MPKLFRIGGDGPENKNSTIVLSVCGFAADGIRMRGDYRFNEVSDNSVEDNLGHGIFVGTGPGGNTFRENELEDNGLFDASDRTTGTGTAGTANVWVDNDCETANPPELCDD